MGAASSQAGIAALRAKLTCDPRDGVTAINLTRKTRAVGLMPRRIPAVIGKGTPMFTTARLIIDSFSTTLTVTGDGQRSRHNILGTPADGDWYTDLAGYACSAADRQLAALGYVRAGDWVGRDGDTFIAPIQPR